MAANISEKYHIYIRIIHWAMALIILGMIGVGWYMSGLPKDGSLRNVLVDLHKSFGVLILILFFVRVAIRLATKIPPLPGTIPALQRKLAHLGHFMLYGLIFIVPLSGYAMSNMFGYRVKMFGLEMPKIFPDDKVIGRIAHEAHEILPYIFLAIIALHVAAVIQHHFFDKPENDILKRMV